ncbi:MAG TPA: nucleotide sugar dehydrogenase [Chloroflexia bacterium]|nr:nucleotide sugar dehydrogenase [Chloroflexia bacterium]
MTDFRSQLLARFASREAHVAIIGLGYVGLPLAVALAEAGYRVTGIDLDARKIDAIARGESYIEDVASETLARWVQSGRLGATSDIAVLRECDAVSICVPTPLAKTGDPDISYIVKATESVSHHLHPGMVVVLESTTYPGTTTEVMLPHLEGNGAGLRVGEDFFLAFSPERVDPGRTDWTTRTMPKVIGGVTPACLEVALAYYSPAIETLVPVSSPEVAEMAKLLENTFRAVNIGLVNEVLLMADKLGLDAWEIIEAAGTKPFGFMKFVPGPGLGGHCIPIDPLYLSWKLKTLNYTARFIELASEVNTAMPYYWVQKVQDALNDAGKPVKGSEILVLGVAYKKDVSDVRESPSLDIIHLLEEKGAHVRYHDPHVPSFHHEGMEMAGVVDLEAALAASDCVVIATDHSAYDWAHIAVTSRIVVDTRHALADARMPAHKT